MSRGNLRATFYFFPGPGCIKIRRTTRRKNSYYLFDFNGKFRLNSVIVDLEQQGKGLCSRPLVEWKGVFQPMPRILIVDDEAACRNPLARLLQIEIGRASRRER